MIEGQAELVAFEGHGFEGGTGIHQLLLAVGLGQGPECQPPTHLLFVRRMDVSEITDVVDDGHADVGHRLCRRLRFPELTDDLRISAIVEGRNLDEIEREITLAP